MNVEALLTPDRILVPLDAGDLATGLGRLRALPDTLPDDDARADGRTIPGDDVKGGSGSALRFPAPDVALAVIDGARADRVLVGIAPEPLLGAEQTEGLGPRIVVVVERKNQSRIGADGLDRLATRLSDSTLRGFLAVARSADDVRARKNLMQLRIADPLTVRDALVPLAYRIYPDTPISEVLDLMGRKGLFAVPVVSPTMQVLGILSCGDALRLVIEGNDATGRTPARELMTRTVLCVTEDQELTDAARTMVNRNFRQLPVIREGEIVGFLTRESVLRALSGNTASHA